MTASALITGANRGIGLSLCKHYRQSGFQVVGVCRSSSSELARCANVVLDGIDIGAAACGQQLKDELGDTSIDLLINNAGILRNEVLGQLDFHTIEQQFRVNTLGALRVTEALLDNLTADAKVAIITSRMGSIADNTSGGRYGYRMSKAALNAAAKSLALDLEPRGIAVAVLHPGLVGTEMIGGRGDVTPDQAAERLAARIQELDLSNTGTFWHANGEVLPW